MPGLDDCEEIETDKTVERCHNGRCFSVANPKNREIGVVKVDGCLINDQSRRVDWMVRLPIKRRLKDGTECFKLVELKGSDVIYAFTQMRATITNAALDPHRELVNEGFIVSQLNPGLLSIAQNEAAKFVSEFRVVIRLVKRAEINAAPA